MQAAIYLIIGLLIGYLFFKVRNPSEKKIIEKSVESQVPVQSQTKLEKITNPSSYSEKLKAGSKDYIFDIRETQKRDKYIHITESRLKEGKEISSNIVIFEDHIEEFSKMLEEMKEKLSALVSPLPSSGAYLLNYTSSDCSLI